jgi:hypothetical protein
MQVRISKPAKSAMQSADGNAKWLLEFVQIPASRSKEPLMGRTSSSDMSNEVKLFFPTLEEATIFAKKKNYSYEVIEPQEAIIPKKSYTSNFN